MVLRLVENQEEACQYIHIPVRNVKREGKTETGNGKKEETGKKTGNGKKQETKKTGN